MAGCVGVVISPPPPLPVPSPGAPPPHPRQGRCAPWTPARPERPRPQTPDGLSDADRGGRVDRGGGWGTGLQPRPHTPDRLGDTGRSGRVDRGVGHRPPASASHARQAD
ncbi:hypothetical protein BOG92_038670 [Streptomyces sp. WAC00263]|nr:hypothetical protein BOG92_038670 [Streptomyces sp. WAC00263]